MISEVILASTVLVLLICFLKPTEKGKKLPGPSALPFFGNVFQVGRKPHLTFHHWAKIYGPIYKIKVGPVNGIVVNHHEYITELLSDIASSGRLTSNAVILEFAKGPNGIFNSEGRTWDEQRKFTIHTLKNQLGFAHHRMESIIVDELKVFIDWLHQKKGRPVQGNRIFNAPVVNSLWRLVTSDRCEWELNGPSTFDIADDFFKVISEVSINGILFVPFMRHIMPKYLSWDKYVKCTSDIIRVFSKYTDQHRKTLDPKNPRDYIDYYLMEMAKAHDPESSFFEHRGEENLSANILDLFIGGSETTSNILSWTMLYLGAYPDIQRKVHEELDRVLGSCSPSLADRKRLPYLDALISEVLRITSVLAYGVPHRMTADMDFHGYHISKGTIIFPNLYGAHHDPDVWGDPENFRPERFLSKDGKTCLRNKALIPFAAGRRKCIGDSLSQNTLFLYISHIFLQFTLKLDLPDGEKPSFESCEGLLLNPKPFKIIASPRF